VISMQTRGSVAVIQVTHGKANALDTALCQELAAQLGQAARAGHRAVVLTGQGGIFSAGVDLLRVREGGSDYLAGFLPALIEAFLAVFGCPVPVVAAVNGHAIAGGCVIACACDHRVMNADHGRIGITELLVGVPFPVSALEIMRFAVGTHRLAELTCFGRAYPAAEALRLGLIDESVPGESVLDRAVAVASEFGALSPGPLRHTRAQIRRPALDLIAQQLATDDQVLQMWDSPAARQAISDYVTKVLHR
jgi:enoyl-CoA hydratase/carnithine racemase